MFYEKQPVEQRENYKYMLALIGSLSNLFADSETPMLYYRAHENVFCKYFKAENLSREDCSADAAKGVIGVGLKTWVGSDNQKVAEFGKLRPQYKHLSGIELVKTISEYRNERIRVTKVMHGLSEMVYHVVKRIPGAMKIYESSFEPVDIKNISLDINKRNDNNIYFSDGKHKYHFSMSKNTLFMMFDTLELMDEFSVKILDDPFESLKAFDEYTQKIQQTEEMAVEKRPQLCLRLYAIESDGKKYVPEKSGLNQWNAGGRKRDPNEIYIPYLKVDHKHYEDFFPSKDTPFELILPDGNTTPAKVCQSLYKKASDEEYNGFTNEEKELENWKRKQGKAVMSNPNKFLGKWLLRDVFNLKEGTLVTYNMLKVFNIDSVVFTRIKTGVYKIDFCELGTYEKFYGLEDIEA